MKKRIEFIKNVEDHFVEIRLYDSFNKCSSCLCWKIPINVIEELIKWWKEKKQIKVDCSKEEKRGHVQFYIYLDESVKVEELDDLGRPKLVGWCLPRIVIDELNKWWETKK